jgi:hypothetical protein
MQRVRITDRRSKGYCHHLNTIQYREIVITGLTGTPALNVVWLEGDKIVAEVY